MGQGPHTQNPACFASETRLANEIQRMKDFINLPRDQPVNIAFVGPARGGKSSVIKSTRSVLAEEYISLPETGNSDEHITIELERYKISDSVYMFDISGMDILHLQEVNGQPSTFAKIIGGYARPHQTKLRENDGGHMIFPDFAEEPEPAFCMHGYFVVANADKDFIDNANYVAFYQQLRVAHRQEKDRRSKDEKLSKELKDWGVSRQFLITGLDKHEEQKLDFPTEQYYSSHNIGNAFDSICDFLGFDSDRVHRVRNVRQDFDSNSDLHRQYLVLHPLCVMLQEIDDLRSR
jgi:hypothetical protein